MAKKEPGTYGLLTNLRKLLTRLGLLTNSMNGGGEMER